MKRFISSTRCAILLCFLMFCASVCRAQTPPQSGQTLRVATRELTPFIFTDKGKRVGFSIDLWEAIAAQLKTKSSFQTNNSVRDLLSQIQNGKADVGIAAISITSEREQKFDFSQPMFNSGLQILVRQQKGASGGLVEGLLSLFTPALWKLLGFMMVIVLVPAHLIWLFERHKQGGIIENKRYFPGIFKAIWWSAGTLGAQVDEMPKSALGRVVALFWMFSGIVFVAYFTAVVTASLTIQQLQGDIHGPENLPGKRVATTLGSTSSAYLRTHNIAPIEYSNLAETYDALLKNEADAVVFDSPVLLYYATRDGVGKVQVVGNVFKKEDYGIVFPRDSSWRKPVNEALLKLREDGKYEEIYDKWFAAGGSS